MSSSTVPYIGSKISLVSNSEIRYEGILYTINTQESTIALQAVRCFGTEGRKIPEIPPSSEVYDFIIFRGQDIKDLTVLESSSAVKDPAIVSINQRPQGSKAADAPQKGGSGGAPAGSKGGDKGGGKGGGGGGGKGTGRDSGYGNYNSGGGNWGGGGGSQWWDRGGNNSWSGGWGGWGGGWSGGGGGSRGDSGKGGKADSGKGKAADSGKGAKGKDSKGKGPADSKGGKAGGGKGGKADSGKGKGGDSKGGKGKGGDAGGRRGGRGGGGGGGGNTTAISVGELPPEENAEVKKECAEEFDVAGANDKFEKVNDSEGVADKMKPLGGYDKSKSFFDNISCEASERAAESERVKVDRDKARQFDKETFGDTQRPPRPSGGRPSKGRRRGGAPRGYRS